MKKFAAIVRDFLLLLGGWLKAMPSWVAMKTGRRRPDPEPVLLNGWVEVGPKLSKAPHQSVSDYLKKNWKTGAWLVLFCLIAHNVVNADSRQREKAAADLRWQNEQRATFPPPVGLSFSENVFPIRAEDLARSFKEDRKTAEAAYRGRLVAVRLVKPYSVSGREVRWHLADSLVPPVVVCEMAEDFCERSPVVWLTGTCAGAEADGVRREFSGYDFRVRIVNCTQEK